LYLHKHYAWLKEQQEVEQPRGLPPLPEAPPLGFYRVDVADLEISHEGAFADAHFALSPQVKGALQSRLCLVMDSLRFPAVRQQKGKQVVSWHRRLKTPFFF
jgi:hypothetical protein